MLQITSIVSFVCEEDSKYTKDDVPVHAQSTAHILGVKRTKGGVHVSDDESSNKDGDANGSKNRDESGSESSDESGSESNDGSGSESVNPSM